MINEFVQAGVWILLPFVGGVVTGIIAMAIALSMMGRGEEEMECENCEVIEMCRKMFGKYWPDKSDGGRGCEHPVYVTPRAAQEVVEKELLKDAVVSNPPMKSAPPEWRQKELQLAAGAMNNPETESLKRLKTRTGEYVPLDGEVEKRGNHHAVSCGGKEKVPEAETPGGTNRPADAQVQGIRPTPAHRTNHKFIQEELI